MSDAPITPDQPLSVTLSIAQWRVVLETLANGPFRVVGPLIGDIERQCQTQIQRMQPPPMMRGNGAEERAHE
jgi:hypothetical protein